MKFPTCSDFLDGVRIFTIPPPFNGANPGVQAHCESRHDPARIKRLFVKSLGEGDPPLLMVHGGPDWDHSYLIPAARRIAEVRRVVLFDLRGCGHSRRYDSVEEHTHQKAAGDIVELAADEGSPVDLLGISFGGKLAVDLILHGRYDFRFPAAYWERFEGRRNVRRVLLEDAGHLAHLEQTRFWCDEVLRFLKDLDER